MCQIPSIWVEEMSADTTKCQDNFVQGGISDPNAGGPVDRTLQVNFTSWTVTDDSWIIQDDDPESIILLYCFLNF